jgi:uncharacterized protein
MSIKRTGDNMAGLRDTIVQSAPAVLALGGGVIGMVFGYTVYRTNFCTMGSISDFVNFQDWRRFRAWVLAATTALIGAQLLAVLGTVDLTRSMYVSANLNWLGHIVGGLMFGFGMVLAGGCASRNLARVGGGDLRSLIVLVVMGIFAYMAIGGLLGPARNWLEQMTAIDLKRLGLQTQTLGAFASKPLGVDVARADLVMMGIVAGVALVYCFMDQAFRTSRIHITSGVVIGLCAVAGWALTGLAFDELSDKPTNPISLTYVRPTADSLEWLQRFTAGMMPGFGVATVFGAIFGAFVAAKQMGRFQFATFSSTGDTKRNLMGAALMGIGGVMALGCTVGQAITGISTLAVGAFLTFAAIVIGGVRGMAFMEKALMDEI